MTSIRGAASDAPARRRDGSAVVYPPGSVWSLRRGRRDPIGFLQTLAADDGDLVHFSLAGQSAFLLKHPDDIEEVLVSHHQKFMKGYALRRAKRLLGNGLLTAEGDLHRRRRRVVQPAFSRQRMDAYGALMVACAARWCERWQSGQIVDVADEMNRLTLAIVGETLFGADVDALTAEVRQALTTAIDSLDALVSLLAPMRRVRPARERLSAIVDGLIAQRCRTDDDRDDLLSMLLHAQDSEGETDTEQVRDDALTIFLAGHDTMATALCWTWCLLAQHPDVEARLHQELDAVPGSRLPTPQDLSHLTYTKSVLAEALRLYPPAWLMARRAVEDHEVGTMLIPTGALVLMSQYLVHRDPRFFPDPLVFDPDRWLPDRQARRPKLAYFPFGAGPRSCIGEGFAWMEGVLLLATHAQRWRFRPVATDPIAIEPRITLRPRHRVTMILQRRTSSDAW